MISTVDDHGDDRFGGFTEVEVDQRGRLETEISHADVVRAATRIMKSGVLTLLEDWDQIDNPVPGRGGRPPVIPRGAILVGMLLLASEKNSLWIRNLNRVLYRRLTQESRDYLGLPTPVASFGIASGEETRWEKNVGNSFHRILRLMDPYPMKRYVNLAYGQIRDVLAAHDKHREQIARARLNEFTNALLHMTYREQPRHIRRVSNQLDISFDQTVIRSASLAKQYAPKRLEALIAAEVAAIASGDIDEIQRLSKTSTVDPFAGFHAKSEDNRSDLTPGSRDSTSPVKRGGKDTEYIWGWEVNIAVRVDSEAPGARRFPQLAVAATLSMPNVGVSEEAVELMRIAAQIGLTPGLADADKQYWANALPSRLHLPARALGWTPSTDYRIDRLGPQGKDGELGTKDGVIFIEGLRLCPGTPKALQMASVDHEKKQNGVDDEVYKVRIENRRAFQVRAKERPDAKGRQPVSCPARSNSPTVSCPIFELLMAREGKALPAVAEKERIRVDEADAPDMNFLPKICRQHSVTLQQEDDIRTSQGFQYKSEEWHEFHEHARNSIEGLNGNSKDDGQESIDSPSRRRVRGFAAAGFFMAFLLTVYNLRAVATFLKEEAIAALKDQPSDPGEKKQRRRDRVSINRYTGTLPSDPVILLYHQGKLASPLRT
ncbi:MAG: hypothetical protein IR160_02110 [Salinibacterium sp.]|nr:hypothetical protein [Salinibacterium sp.]MBF0671362.1 hypothetical protein [Salinibacterium sp.]